MNVLDVSQLAQPLAAAHTHILAAGPHEASGVEGTAQYVSIFWVTLAALLSPIMSRLTGKRIPDVVFLLICGVLIGPNALGLASGSDGGIPLLKELGLGMLFLIAGFEINVDSLRNRQGKSAIATWFVCFTLGVLGAALITGFALGYADPEAPVNAFRAPRRPVSLIQGR